MGRWKKWRLPKRLRQKRRLGPTFAWCFGMIKSQATNLVGINMIEQLETNFKDLLGIVFPKKKGECEATASINQLGTEMAGTW